MSKDDFQKVLELGIEGCKAVGKYMRETMLEHTRQLATARGAVHL